MLHRKGIAAVAACAAMACAGLARGADREQARNALTLEQQPIYAAAAAPRKPLMNALDKAGLASQLDSAGINIGGFAEVSWTYNFDTPNNQINAGRVFDFEDQDPTFNQLDLFVERAVSASSDKFDLGGRIEWIWGGDARLIHSNGLFDHYGPADGPDEQFDPVQAYVQMNLPVGNGVVATAGKFVTLLGYETINPTTNPLYSHTYLFGFAIPFTNTGVMGKYAFNDNWSVSAAVVRGWDQALEDSNSAWSYMGQIAYTSKNFDVYVNGITGCEQPNDEHDWRSVIDGILVYRVGDNLQLVANGDFGYEAKAATDGGDAKWYGIAGYAIYSINDNFGLVGRAEYFNDDDGARGLGTSVYEVTAGLNVKPMPGNEWGAGLLIRPELRWDHSNDNIFNDAQDENQYTFGVDAIYAF